MDSDPVKSTFILLLYFIFLVSIPLSLLAQPGQLSLTDNITTALKEEGLTGAVWAIRHVDHRDVFGYAGFRDAENQLPFTLETRFHVGSVCKSLLATGLLRLVSTGTINLDDPAEKYLTGLTFSNPWANDNPVTVRHLLDHTSGIDDARLWQMFSTRIKPDTPLVEAFRPQPEVLDVRARPGSRFSYSNMGYTLLGLIIETVTGEPYETYLDRELLQPLGMHDSTFAFTTQTGKDALPGLAWGHIDDGSRYPAAPVMLRPAGQFTTTAKDWLLFAQFLMGDGSLNGESFINRDLMHTRGTATTTQASLAGLEVGYAVGLSKLDRYGAMGLCHSGNIVGFNALMCVYPDSGQAFVISINTDSETANYKRVHQLVADTLSFPTLPVPETSLPAADVSDWQGLYVLRPNRFASFRYLDMVFGYARLEWKEGILVFDPFQGVTRKLRPTGKYLLSADDRRVNSHVLLRDENNEPLLSDGYRTYSKTNPAIIYGLWFSLGLALAGMLWFVTTGAFAIKRKGMAGFLTPQGIALAGILGLLLPIPVFFTQSFMALGDKTPASLMLAVATVLLPLTMLVTHSKIVRNKSRNSIDTLHGMAAVCVLQWCATLYYFDLLPLRLWT